jgi:hypothetical protein
MPLIAYPPIYAFARPSALRRALYLWLLSNLGGTCWLALDFGLDHPTDLVVPLCIGLLAALVSLVCVPLTWFFLSLAHRAGTSWRCRLMAIATVLVVFMLANLLLLQWLPIGPLDSLLSISKPYLGAAFLAVMWLYGPAPTSRKPAPAAHLLSMWWHPAASAKAYRWIQLQSAP